MLGSLQDLAFAFACASRVQCALRPLRALSLNRGLRAKIGQKERTCQAYCSKALQDLLTASAATSRERETTLISHELWF